ncbi:MAG: hypothetical protein Kow0099_21740 [Candidatus Abyssubacteria bacterium]
MLGLLGLDVGDPLVIESARQAHALYSVEALPSDDRINVTLRLSDTPDFKSYLYKEDRRLVLDLRNTINICPTSKLALGQEGPITEVRNSQFRVEPSFISRVVLDLDEYADPEIRTEGTNLVISALVIPKEARPAQPTLPASEATSEVVSVPAVPVDVESDFVMVAHTIPAAPAMTPHANEKDASQAPQHMEEKASDTEPILDESADEKVASTDTAQNVEIAKADIEQTATESETAEEPAITETQSETVVNEPDTTQSAASPAEAEETVEGELMEPAYAVAVAKAAEVPATDETETPAEAPALEPEEASQAPEEAPMTETAEASEIPQPEPVIQVAKNQEPEPMQPEPVKEEPAPVADPPAEEENELEEQLEFNNHVTLTFRDADLNAVLDILARKGNINILAGKDVRGTVTVRLVDVPFDVALNAILNVNGYGYIKTDNIVRIVPLSQLGKVVETTTETYLLSYAEAEEAKNTLTPFLTPNGGIQTDKRTNMLIVTDVPSNMDRIRKLVPAIDRRVQQVLIEVLILDSVLSDATDLGIQWTLFNADDNSLVQEEQSITSTSQDAIGVNIPVTGQAIQLSFGTLLGDFKLDAFISAMVENSDSRVLANPKILTLNNEAASIEIVEEFPYSDVTQTSSGGQLSNITFKEIGTKLEVTPQITHDEHVILKVAPEQNSIAGTTVTGVPRVDTRRAETTLIVKNHQTIVLGGLRENRKLKGITKVPLLGDLPGVKYAFRSVSSDDTDTELLVFITVHIVDSPPLLAEQKIKFGELANLPRKPSTQVDLVR